MDGIVSTARGGGYTAGYLLQMTGDREVWKFMVANVRQGGRIGDWGCWPVIKLRRFTSIKSLKSIDSEGHGGRHCADGKCVVIVVIWVPGVIKLNRLSKQSLKRTDKEGQGGFYCANGNGMVMVVGDGGDSGGCGCRSDINGDGGYNSRV